MTDSVELTHPYRGLDHLAMKGVVARPRLLFLIRKRILKFFLHIFLGRIEFSDVEMLYQV